MPADREWPNAAANAAEPWRVQRAARESSTAAEASPVVPVPPCPTCKGEGLAPTVGYDVTMGADSLVVRVACPSCNGSGRDRLIPESEIRAWIKDNWRGFGPLDEIAAWLDERGER